MSPRRRREAVPPGQPVPIELIPILEGEPLYVRWLRQPRGVLAHWGAKGPIGCPGERSCPAAIHRGRTVWKGYAAGEYYRPEPYGDWAPGVIEVTARLMECLEGHDLRGEVWRCQRQPGRGSRIEVTGELVGTVNADTLRQPWPEEPTVYRIYGTTSVLLDVTPYLPPRLILPPVPGPAPTVEPSSEQHTAAQRASVRDTIRRHLVAGTLPESYRRSMPKLVAAVEQELQAAADRAPGPPPERPAAPAPPPGPPPSPNGRHR